MSSSKELRYQPHLAGFWWFLLVLHWSKKHQLLEGLAVVFHPNVYNILQSRQNCLLCLVVAFHGSFPRHVFLCYIVFWMKKHNNLTKQPNKSLFPFFLNLFSGTVPSKTFKKKSRLHPVHPTKNPLKKTNNPFKTKKSLRFTGDSSSTSPGWCRPPRTPRLAWERSAPPGGRPWAWASARPGAGSGPPVAGQHRKNLRKKGSERQAESRKQKNGFSWFLMVSSALNFSFLMLILAKAESKRQRGTEALDVQQHGGRKKFPKAMEKRVNELYATWAAVVKLVCFCWSK